MGLTLRIHSPTAIGERVSPRANPSATDVSVQIRVMRDAVIARNIKAYEMKSVIYERVIGINGVIRLPGWMGTNTTKDDRLRRIIVV